MTEAQYEHEGILGVIDNEICIPGEEADDKEISFLTHSNEDQYYVQLNRPTIERETQSSPSRIVKTRRKIDRHSSKLWTYFRIVSSAQSVAACSICGALLSFRSTTSNLRKHIIRKHGHLDVKSNPGFKVKYL